MRSRQRLTALACLALLAGACKPAAPTVAPTQAEADPNAGASVTPPEAPPAETADDLHTLLAPIVDQSGVPGLGAAVIDREGVVAIGVAGVRRADDTEPLRIDDRFHLGSDTKAMTAYVVGRLVDQGTLRFDDTLADLFPDSDDWLHADYRDVTVDDLLTHRSGLPANALWGPLNLLLATDDPPEHHRDIVARFALSQAPDHPPHGAFLYANLGYIVLGAALRSHTGDSWEQLISRELFDPLGMKTCGFGPVSTPESPDGSWAHELADGTYRPVDIDNPLYLGPAGTVHCSLQDWGRFAQTMFDDTDTLSPETLVHLRTPLPAAENEKSYARGWLVSDAFPLGETIITHDGSNTVNYASIVIAPHRGLAILAASNAAPPAAQRAVVQAVRALLHHYGRPANVREP